MKFLFAGLGNIGDEYAHTRHNIGFDILDRWTSEAGIPFALDRHAFYAEIKHKGKTACLIKPTTYMNLSGKAVNYWLQQHRIPKENLMVITDDLALPSGKIRIRQKGSDGGHNGLKSINETLATHEYARLRFGIGNDFSKGRQVDFVLSRWDEEEAKIIKEGIERSVEALKTFMAAGIVQAMNTYNK
jgi:PTH1 family peptidyl-tRNA hydrolase